MKDETKTLTNPNKSGEIAGGSADAANGAAVAGIGAAEALRKAAAALDPLGVAPEVGHLLPAGPVGGGAESPPDLTGEAKKPEAGARPLENKRREQFCRVLTGWGGDGTRKRNAAAYEAVYGKGGATARSQSSWLLAIPEVKERVAYLERRVEEAKRHDYKAAQQEIDELRLGIIERGKRNGKLAAVALVAARDFEAAHGLRDEGRGSAAVEAAVVEAGDGLTGIRAVLARVVKGVAP